MENINTQELQLYKKAKRHVSFSILFMFLLLILYYVILYYIDNQVSFLTISDSFRTNLYLLVAIEVLTYILLNSWLMKGKKLARFLFWIVFLLEVGTLYFPITALKEDPNNALSYIVVMLAMILKCSILIRFGSYLRHNEYCKILFEHKIDIPELYEEEKPRKKEKEIFEPVSPPPVPLHEREIDQEELEQIIEKELQESQEEVPIQQVKPKKEKIKKPKKKLKLEKKLREFSLPSLAIQLSIVVYGSLAGFPILITVFNRFFCSLDGQTLFATGDIFTFCILTAVLWTFAILFLYYDHPKSKMIVSGCFLGELLGFLFYLPKFLGYINGDVEYSLRVYILFMVVNFLRYLLIFTVVKPIYFEIDGKRIMKKWHFKIE